MSNTNESETENAESEKNNSGPRLRVIPSRTAGRDGRLAAIDRTAKERERAEERERSGDEAGDVTDEQREEKASAWANGRSPFDPYEGEGGRNETSSKSTPPTHAPDSVIDSKSDPENSVTEGNKPTLSEQVERLTEEADRQLELMEQIAAAGNANAGSQQADLSKGDDHRSSGTWDNSPFAPGGGR